jgi:beta-lactam-binding protein with PASTA domain
MKQFFIYYLSSLFVFSCISIFLIIRFKKLPLKIFHFLLIATILPIILCLLIYIYFLPSPESLVPNVVGYKEKSAVEILRSSDFVPMIEERIGSVEVVSNQRPEGGMWVKKGRIVFLKIGKVLENE